MNHSFTSSKEFRFGGIITNVNKKVFWLEIYKNGIFNTFYTQFIFIPICIGCEFSICENFDMVLGVDPGKFTAFIQNPFRPTFSPLARPLVSRNGTIFPMVGIILS